MASKPTVFSVPSELTLAVVESLRASVIPLLAMPDPLLILDLSGCHAVTTPGLGLLLEFHRLAKEQGGKLVLASPTERVGEVIHRTQLDRVFLVAGSLPDAFNLISK